MLAVDCLRMLGQARKSLWIETARLWAYNKQIGVRLVRACGSKPSAFRRISRDKLVRLVRACGSKLLRIHVIPAIGNGQARKSLWIETDMRKQVPQQIFGQARKSLWIETMRNMVPSFGYVGQARKSLWIETEC